MRLSMKPSIAYGFIIIGAAFWGSTGLFVTYLYRFGFTPWEVVAIRLAMSSIVLFGLMITMAKKYLRIKWRHIPYFFVLGIISIALFNWCYFEVIDRASLSIAVIFVYTSPVFAAIIAFIFFKEEMSWKKGIAILFTIFGCALVIGYFPGGNTGLDFLTIVLGLAAGLFCSLFSVIGKLVSRYYHPLTVTFYAMLCGSLFMVPTSSIWKKGQLFAIPDVWGIIAGITLISTIAAYLLYTMGLTYVESSKAAILSSVELVVSVLIGVTIFKDAVDYWQWIGFLFVFCSLFLTVFPARKSNHAKKRIEPSN
ncbi:DMT family transporter [Sediminibacillus halophilus]|uniref:Threonine/homoserine efflux transporter RhtA n=1 Tax=Sediminibacillus halophilus TaxID=482461 RepID=A0A1G9M5Z9_9BACI|nr:DMT family transporter [Sediminibacillus halophilus]SDL69377.1 Threonine/homoserine efflux transporter RhtA [Sediminibacillus halophilus]